MSDFTKNKIAFAIALLATLFAISPIVEKFSTYGFYINGVLISVEHLYYALNAFIALSVYLFGVQFITERPLKLVQITADILYAISLILPPIYLVLYLLVPIITLIVNSSVVAALGGMIAATVQFLVSSLFGTIIFGIAVNLIYDIAKGLFKRESRSRTEKLENDAIQTMSRVTRLIGAGEYNLAIIESSRTIEIALQKALAEKGIPTESARTSDLAKAAAKYKLLSADLLVLVQKTRALRNKIAHGGSSVTKADAEAVLSDTNEVLTALKTFT